MDKKKNKGTWVLKALGVLFVVYISLTIAISTGYYEAKLSEKTTITDEAMQQFEQDVREGKDVAIVATGLPGNNCLEVAEMLAADGINAKVINIHTIKPLDEELIVAAAQETGKVVTVEEHSVIGGLGSAVCDVLSEKAPTKVMKIGIYDVFGESGPALELLKKYGLDTDGIYKKIKEFV